MPDQCVDECVGEGKMRVERPVVLIIRDGWGLNEKLEGNAVAAAWTPNIDSYKSKLILLHFCQFILNCNWINN